MSYRMFLSPFRAQFRRAFSGVCTTLSILLVLTSGALAQTDQEHQAYVQAVTILTKQAESAPLERLVQRTASDYLKRQGLEWLVVNCLRRGETARAKGFAEQLLGRDTDNALALAVTSDAITQTTIGGQDSDKAIGKVKRALRGLPQLKAPELMEEAEFSSLKNRLEEKLNGAAGYAYYQQNDYVSARNYLRKAVTLAPENAQYAYALAICDLLGKDGDEAEGYRLLARTVNLTQGTPAGQELASFARRKYQERGGSSGDWDRYLVATRLPATSASAVATATKTQQPQPTTAPGPKVAANQPAKNSQPIPSKVASAGPAPEAAPLTDLPPAAPVRREIAPPGAAFSLGILIQTSQASHQGKRAVINTLSDMVRHLRDGDEAFLVSFAHNVAFEEDLTGNAKLLEQAMDQIRPASGTALFDAVAFAAGHLNRIARNRKRVLLVVSDGQNETSQISPLELAHELRIGDVEIYCIGINSNTLADQYRLESLAARTGGRALFVADASQFRTAANQVAANLGIGMR